METQENIINRPPVREAGIAYSLSAILSVLLSLIISVIIGIVGTQETGEDWYKYLGFLLSQIVFAATAGVFFGRTKRPLREFYRPSRWHYFPIAVLMQFGLLFSLNFLNDYFIRFLELFGYRSTMADSIPSLDGWNLLPALLVIAVLPAFFEETFFRGILFGGMRRGGWGTLPAVLISGALFSLYHGNPEQTVYQFFCGAAFALLAQRSGSILPGMLAHLLNNGLILILTARGIELSALPPFGAAVLYVLSALCLIGSLLWLLLEKKNVRGGVRDGKGFFLTASVGIGVCAIEWIYALIAGFAA